MDSWNPAVIDDLARKRHRQDLAQGAAARRGAPSPGMRARVAGWRAALAAQPGPATRARRAARTLAVALAAGLACYAHLGPDGQAYERPTPWG